MVAPLPETGEEATCSLWLMAMDPQDPARNVGRKVSFPVSEMSATAEPFELRIGAATLTRPGMSGSLEQDGVMCEWDLIVGIAAAGLRTRPPSPEKSEDRQDGAVPAAPRARRARLRPDRRAADRRRRRHGRAGAPVGVQARGALGMGALQRLRRRRRQRPPRSVRRRRERVRAPLRPRDRPQHAGCGTRGRGGRHVDRPARRHAQPERVRARPLELRGARGPAEARPARFRRGARTWSASPTTTPTASWPTATTPRWPTCGSTCGSVTGRRAPWRKLDELRSARHAHFEYAQRTPVDGVPLLVR